MSTEDIKYQSVDLQESDGNEDDEQNQKEYENNDLEQRDLDSPEILVQDDSSQTIVKTIPTSKLISKLNSSGKVVYPSRIQRIGEMKCFFLSFYHDGKFPICNIGPSTCPMIFMLGFGIFILGYFSFMIETWRDKAPIVGLLSYLAVFCIWVLFFMTMFKDPGVDKSIYEHHIKVLEGCKTDEANTTNDEDECEEGTCKEESQIENDDYENSPSSNGLKQRTNQKTQETQKESNADTIQTNQIYLKFIEDREYRPVKKLNKQNNVILFCEKCNVEVARYTQHCMACQVCISNMDHYCVFYSKCIGEGNVKEFFGTIVGFLITLGGIGIFTSMYGDFE